MMIQDMEKIAQIAEDKRVRIELLPEGFGITARAPVKGKGMVEIKQIIQYDKANNFFVDSVKLFEQVIDETIEKLKQESRRK